MTCVHRHAHARPRDSQVWYRQNLATFIAQLLFFISLKRIIVGVLACKGQHIESNRCRKLSRHWISHGFAVVGQVACHRHNFARLLIKFIHSSESATRNGLIRTHDESIETSFIVQNFQHWHGRHRRAIGIGNNPLGCVVNFLRIDFANY